MGGGVMTVVPVVVVLSLLKVKMMTLTLTGLNVARAAFISRSVNIDYKRALGYSSSSRKRITSFKGVRGARSETVFDWGLVVGVRWGRLYVSHRIVRCEVLGLKI